MYNDRKLRQENGIEYKKVNTIKTELGLGLDIQKNLKEI